MIEIFPVCTRGNFSNGSVFERATYCKIGKSKKCKEYCIKPNFSSLTKCPFGLTVYKLNNYSVVYGIKVEGFYNRRKDNANSFCPVLKKEFFFNILKKIDRNATIKSSESNNFIDNVFHEIRKLNRAIKSSAEKGINILKETDNEYALNKMKNVFASSTLISMRLNLYDFEANPQKITREKRRKIGVFKKFEKAVHILEEEARNKLLEIKIIGNSHYEIEALSIFDLLPFVIIENAIKYSPKNQEIILFFSEQDNHVNVEISSIGPTATQQDLSGAFEKQFRGSNAIKVDSTGYGYGLYLAKVISDLHNIKISITSNQKKFKLDGIPYSDFKVNLVIGPTIL
jgi:signal transduction histidine kinase